MLFAAIAEFILCVLLRLLFKFNAMDSFLRDNCFHWTDSTASTTIAVTGCHHLSSDICCMDIVLNIQAVVGTKLRIILF